MDRKNVEAIEEGRIVTVSELYAKREGLTIIRKPKIKELQENVSHLSPGSQLIPEENKRPLSEMLSRPKDWKKDQVTSELLDNFHWIIRVERKRKGLTRKQFAKILNEPEENLKMIEAGFLPSSDFILINKIQQSLGINLRKDKKDYNQSLPQVMKSTRPPKQEPQSTQTQSPEQKDEYEFSGTDIEIFEDEI